jgi:hypothetical protein
MLMTDWQLWATVALNRQIIDLCTHLMTDQLVPVLIMPCAFVMMWGLISRVNTGAICWKVWSIFTGCRISQVIQYVAMGQMHYQYRLISPKYIRKHLESYSNFMNLNRHLGLGILSLRIGPRFIFQGQWWLKWNQNSFWPMRQHLFVQWTDLAWGGDMVLAGLAGGITWGLYTVGPGWDVIYSL